MDKILVYAADSTVLEDDSLFAKAYDTVTDDRKKKTDEKKFPKDKYLSLAAETLLLYGLSKLELKKEYTDLRYGKYGKPYFENGPCFNLSHSGSFVLCAISDFPVGCDIELIRDIDLSIAKRFFFGSEYEDIMSKKNEKERRETFFRYWVLKESFMKVTGLGMSLPLDDFRIDISGKYPCVSQKLDEEKYDFREFFVSNDYRCAICSKQICGDAEFELLKIENCL